MIAESVSLGLGLTNDCNLACAHCYRETEQINRVPVDLRGPSSLLSRFPMSCRSLVSGHLYSAIGRSFPRYIQDGLADPDVGTAPTQVASQASFDLFHGGIAVCVQERLARHHETGSTEAALLRVVFDEGGLERVHAIRCAQSLDG